jgi:hypothetical protein
VLLREATTYPGGFTGMTDKITLTRAMFDRAYTNLNWDISLKHKLWDTLIAESQRREPIVRWYIEWVGSTVLCERESKAHAEEGLRRYPNERGRIVRLVEASDEDESK